MAPPVPPGCQPLARPSSTTTPTTPAKPGRRTHMTDRTTPIRAARADAMWSDLTDRAEATEYYLERVDARADVPGNADDWRKRGSHMSGILGLLAMYGAEWNTGM